MNSPCCCENFRACWKRFKDQHCGRLVNDYCRSSCTDAGNNGDVEMPSICLWEYWMDSFPTSRWYCRLGGNIRSPPKSSISMVFAFLNLRLAHAKISNDLFRRKAFPRRVLAPGLGLQTRNSSPPSGVGLAGRSLFGQHVDSTEFPIERSLSPFETDKERLFTSTILDMTARKWPDI